MNRVLAVLILVFLALVMVFLAQLVTGVGRVGGLIAEREARGERLAAEFSLHDGDAR